MCIRDSKESKMLSVYQYSNTDHGPVINTLAREAFSAMLPVDIDHDGSVAVSYTHLFYSVEFHNKNLSLVNGNSMCTAWGCLQQSLKHGILS